MRRAIPLRSVDALPWVPTAAPGLLVRELNRDPDTGGRSAMLRSAPRSEVERKAQYHVGDEEFLCLEGEFTFDGIHWFGPGSYVHYPPRTVHGAHVRVPQGYLLYLRTTGDGAAHRVGVPLSAEPYSLDAPVRGGRAFTALSLRGQRRGADGARDARGNEPALRMLRGGGAAHEPGVACLRLEPGDALEFAAGSRTAPAEIFVAEGSLIATAPEGARVDAPAYGFYPEGLDARQFVAASPSLVLAHVGDWP